MNADDLNRQKKVLRGHLEAAARLEGRLAGQIETLQKQFGIDTLEEACEILQETRDQIEDMTKQLDVALAKLDKHSE